VDGKKMSDLPVFVLTSKYTFSGGEEFAYDIQTQKRGTLIGEVTGGGANPGGVFPVTANFGIFIPTGRAINPVTKTNWEGVGVIPEIKCEADKALETALPFAREASRTHRDSVNKIISMQIKEIGLNLEKADKLFDEKKNDEAEKLLAMTLENGLKTKLADENMINTFGYAKLGTGKYSPAIAIFKYNVKAFPNSANVYDSLGEAYMKAGNKKLAIENYEKSLKLNPNSQSSEDALKQLKGNK
jgi:tetratricopeptide (TPR) repeat protein